MNHILFFSPILLTLFGAITLMIFGGRYKLNAKTLGLISIFFLGIADVFSMISLGGVFSYKVYEELFSGMLIADSFGSFFVFVILSGAIITILISQSYFNNKDYINAEFYSLFLFCIFCLLILVQTRELFSAFISLEGASIVLYILIAYEKKNKMRLEASFKYLVIGSVMGALYLLGMALIFAITKSTNLDLISNFLHLGGDWHLVLIGASFILILLLFKIAAFPFHSWSIDVYSGAALPVTSFMAAVFKIGIFAFMMRLVMVDFALIKQYWDDILVFICVLSLIYGTILAIIQTNIKRMLASSSIVHTGYILLAFLAATNFPKIATESLSFYIVSYMLSALGAFGFLSHLSRSYAMVKYEDFKGFASINPILAACMSIFMLSFAGVPITMGFLAKLYVFSTAFEAGYIYLSIFAIIASIISIYYYFKIIVYMYFYKPELSEQKMGFSNSISEKVIVFLALSVLFVGLNISSCAEFILKLVNLP